MDNGLDLNLRISKT